MQCNSECPRPFFFWQVAICRDNLTSDTTKTWQRKKKGINTTANKKFLSINLLLFDAEAAVMDLAQKGKALFSCVFGTI